MGQNGTIIFNILDNTTELYMIKYTFGEIFSSGGATLYKNPSDQTVTHLKKIAQPSTRFLSFSFMVLARDLGLKRWENQIKIEKKLVKISFLEIENFGGKIWTHLKSPS